MKKKYIILTTFNGVTKEFSFPVTEKAEAIACYKNVRMRADKDKTKFFSIDSDDKDIWYDLSQKY